ncbi:SLC13 family permease [Fusobacterium simiae]|uniref:SLC13 family permease n=2 Tax=Fusobacterium TaxID=848 RepID=A0ABT4DI20_FUSSI|nr:SLC13 family permease [Fusobacterium simiae]MCY7008250.1 SLC13 family permease [Fusobacterium simiae]MDC7955541.1 SLC13 family permease [Fusobacterium simiae]
MNEITITLLFLFFTIVLYVTEKIPLALTSMIVCVGLNLTGVLTIKEAFEGFVNGNVILFVAMFIVGGALFETGMASDIGGIITKFAKTEKQLIISIMVIVGLLSGVLSNTGTAAVLIPVVVGVASKSGFARSKLLMPLVFAAALGGNLSLIGAPGNMIANTALESVNMSFGFFEYAKVGLPMLVCAILFYSTIGFKLLPNNKADEKELAYNETDEGIEKEKWKKIFSLVVMIFTILAMIFENKIGIKLQISACIGAIILVLFKVISEEEAYNSIDTKTIFLFGGSLSLATALQKTGAGTIIADTIISRLGENPSPYVLLLVILILSSIMTNFMSNTATTALLVPIGLSIATRINADPRAVLMAMVIGGSCAYATPIGMPANTMVINIGNYKFKDYLKAGGPLVIISIVISAILLPIFFPFY